MTLHYEQFDPENTVHADAAAVISAWTQGEHMLPLAPHDMKGHVLGVLAFHDNPDAGRGVVGYRAVTQQYGPDVYEVGALVVDPAHQGKGYGGQIANKLVDVAQQQLPGATLLAFCNPKSAPISLRRGFTPVTDMSEVPPAALELCGMCPKKAALPAGQLCCDTILALKPVSGELTP